ncbi:hypothetical protein [Aquimixticola soesokkakensis]|nr:hypothetical protein [Aquimixticola soesokkakensis]
MTRMILCAALGLSMLGLTACSRQQAGELMVDGVVGTGKLAAKGAVGAGKLAVKGGKAAVNQTPLGQTEAQSFPAGTAVCTGADGALMEAPKRADGTAYCPRF